MLGHYLLVTLRNLGRQRLHSALALLVLALGLTCFLAASLFALYFSSFERQFANADRIYVIYQRASWPRIGYRAELGRRSGFGVAEKLASEIPELAAVARQFNVGAMVSVGGAPGKLRGIQATDPDWFDIFDFTVVAGEARGALARQSTAVLAESTAIELFGSAVDAVGKTVTFTGQRSTDFTVAGVVADVPGPSHLGNTVLSPGIQIVASWDLFAKLYQQPNTSMLFTNVTTYVLLPEDGSLSARELNQRLDGIAAQPLPEPGATLELEARPVNTIVRDDLQKSFEGFQMGTALPFAIGDIVAWLAWLVLGVGCLNFVNLMTARSMGRAREIGVRKSIGATSARIVAQDLLQTGLIVLLGMVLALLFLAAAVHLTENRWRVLVEVPWSRPVLWGLLGAVLVGVTLAAGAYPAAVLARIRPASALRLGTSRSGPRALRAVLVVAQVAAAAFLGVVVLVVLGQADTMRTAMLGRFADPYVVAILPPSTLRQAGLDVITDEIGRGSGVTGVTASATYPFQLANQGGARLSRAPVDQTMPTRYEMVMVAFDYFSVMQIPVIAGRGYSRDYSDPPSPTTAEEWAALKGPTRVVVDRRAARSLGWPNPADAIGQAVYTSAPRPSEIIGVVESVPLSLRTRDSDGVVYFLDRNFTQVVITRVAAAQTDVALEHLERVWKRFVPEAAIERLFLDEAFETQYRFYRFAQYVLATLAVVAVSIAAIGLFGMAAYVTRRRTREVGLRKSQGASPRRILGMLLFDFTKPVLLGNLLAWPFAFVVARGYVDLFSARMQLTPIPFVLALLGSLLVAWIAVGGFVWRAARLNPTVALREE